MLHPHPRTHNNRRLLAPGDRGTQINDARGTTHNNKKTWPSAAPNVRSCNRWWDWGSAWASRGRGAVAIPAPRQPKKPKLSPFRWKLFRKRGPESWHEAACVDVDKDHAPPLLRGRGRASAGRAFLWMADLRQIEVYLVTSHVSRRTELCGVTRCSRLLLFRLTFCATIGSNNGSFQVVFRLNSRPGTWLRETEARAASFVVREKFLFLTRPWSSPERVLSETLVHASQRLLLR